MQNAPRVQDLELEFYFIQVKAGTEYNLSLELSRNNIKHWKGLGKYDLICISSKGEVEKEWFEECVLDWIQFTAFAWGIQDELDILEEISNAEETHNWMAVVMAKVCPNSTVPYSCSPIQNEYEIAKNIQNHLQEKEIKGLVLGGFGWHELTVLLWGNDIGQLAKQVLDISPKTKPIKTFTIFGLRHKFLIDPSQAKWDDLDTDNSVISTKFLITCKGYQTDQVANTIHKKLSFPHDIGLVYGTEDLQVVPHKSIGLGEIIKKLIILRQDEEFQKVIYSTSTVFIFDHSDCAPQESAASTSPLSESIQNILNKGASLRLYGRGIPENDPTFIDVRRNATQMNLMLRSSLSDQMTQDAYADMIFALHDFSCHEKKDNRKIDINSAKTIFDYISLGYQQRSLGTLTTLWNVGNQTPLFYRGGIQRILWATEYLCHSMFEGSDENWAGFVVFGMVRDYLRSHLGIISLPYRTMFEPQEWWGVFHEMGHEYVDKIAEKIGKEKWTELIIDIYSVPKEHVKGRYEAILHYENVCAEILADIYDYQVGFNEDWEAYFSTVFKYLIGFVLAYETGDTVDKFEFSYGSISRDKLEFYIIRLLAVYFYMWKKKGQEVDCASFVKDVQPRFGEVIKNLELHREEKSCLDGGLRDILKARKLDGLCYAYGIYRLFDTRSGKYLLEYVLPKTSLSTTGNDDIVEGIKKLQNGEVLEQVEHPQKLICSLIKLEQKCPKNISARLKIATILSLWNAYARLLPTKMEKVSEDC